MKTLNEMKAERKIFEEWIYNLRKKVWYHEHATLEREPDPSPTEFKTTLGRYSDNYTNKLWEFWQYDSEGLKLIFSQMTHKFDYSKDK